MMTVEPLPRLRASLRGTLVFKSHDSSLLLESWKPGFKKFLHERAVHGV